MWTYNVCRKLIIAAGKTPWPDEVPLDETPAIRHALAQPPGPDQIYCIKTHFRIPTGKPQMRIICNYRDIRDALLSYMRFMKCSFGKGLSVARGSMELTDHYLQTEHPQVLPVRYDTLVSHPQETAVTLAKFLALPATQADIGEITRALSRDAVARELRKLEALNPEQQGAVQDAGKSGKYSCAPNLDGSYRVYDHATGFQTNHISSGKEGEWREVFSEREQAELMTATTECLIRYNFNL